MCPALMCAKRCRASSAPAAAGLYLTALAATLRAARCAEALGRPVAPHRYLGDADYINAANHCHRHAASLRALFAPPCPASASLTTRPVNCAWATVATGRVAGTG